MNLKMRLKWQLVKTSVTRPQHPAQCQHMVGAECVEDLAPSAFGRHLYSHDHHHHKDFRFLLNISVD